MESLDNKATMVYNRLQIPAIKCYENRTSRSSAVPCDQTRYSYQQLLATSANVPDLNTQYYFSRTDVLNLGSRELGGGGDTSFSLTSNSNSAFPSMMSVDNKVIYGLLISKNV